MIIVLSIECNSFLCFGIIIIYSTFLLLFVANDLNDGCTFINFCMSSFFMFYIIILLL